jgi:hypothetical protein
MNEQQAEALLSYLKRIAESFELLTHTLNSVIDADDDGKRLLQVENWQQGGEEE